MTVRKQLEGFASQLENYLTEQGIELSMGGEPTFVPAVPDAAEWNTAAMGAEKLGYARRMAAELLHSVYPGGLMMQVYGKWYPGEPLPRWNCLTLHRADGSAIWPEQERLLLDDVEGTNVPEQAASVAGAVAQVLGLESYLIPAREQGADRAIVGWVLPLDFVDGQWCSAEWPYSPEEAIELIGGDSQVGLRLPLGDLPADCLQRALTIEVRRGALEIFLPPLEWGAFSVLIESIRSAVLEYDCRDILFCGYAPSGAGDAVTSLGLAADPGVLEVNLPPCSSWVAYDKILRQCADAAAAVGLQLTKYQLNGAVYGTGGGSHLTFGGPSLETNPFLLEPKRVASILRYWQHHPALSYLFTGQFVGPGSQAPRVDEGPSHGLYELEVACEGLEQSVGLISGEHIDQFFKNLLTDSSGNTHRAELCFDKFHNYAQANGCLGIIELRAFETFATVETMSAVALFVRAILVRLMHTPFNAELSRWGATLHDRYFLPAFLWEDILSICADLNAHGFEFDPAWLKPAFDFRCPELGRIDVPGGCVEVRQAFESWPLMAEETSQGANTVRVVDNSTDRLQLQLSDPSLLEHGRLLANGVEVPFVQVGEHLICGLRYKCASAYPALHPHVPIQSPLHLEWVDATTGVSVAAVRYYYWNPHGPVYDGRPVDAVTARARRDERWQVATDLLKREPMCKQPRMSAEYQYTLDLRRQLQA